MRVGAFGVGFVVAGQVVFVKSTGLLFGVTVFLVVALSAALDYLGDAARFPIKRVVTSGTFQHVDLDLLKRTVLEATQRGSWLFNEVALEAALMRLPWIGRAYVRRAWPGEVRVALVEIPAYAILNDAWLVDEQGRRHHLPPKEPGSVNRILLRLEGAEEDSARLVAQAKVLAQILRESPVTVDLLLEKLTQQGEGTWEARLSNGLRVVLGRSQVSERMRRFVKAYALRLKDYANDLQYADLRYAEGLALGWKPHKAELADRLKAG